MKILKYLMKLMMVGFLIFYYRETMKESAVASFLALYYIVNIVIEVVFNTSV